MAKLACEELAHYLEGHYRADVNLIGGKSYASQAKRLRSEARELKRLRRLVVRLNDEQFKYKFAERVPLFMAVRREAERIQKARKK